MPTAIIYNFDLIAGRKAASPPDEVKLVQPLDLFYEWVETMRFANQGGFGDYDDDPIFAAACDRIGDIEDAITALPPSITGMAIKIYLQYLRDHLPLSSEEGWKLGPPTEYYVSDLEVALIRDIVALAPELAPCCAAVIDPPKEAQP